MSKQEELRGDRLAERVHPLAVKTKNDFAEIAKRQPSARFFLTGDGQKKHYSYVLINERIASSSTLESGDVRLKCWLPVLVSEGNVAKRATPSRIEGELDYEI
jgi:hypothetical protein